jgi:hypothetical protein
MKGLFLAFTLLILGISPAFSQSDAVNFNANDCGGTSHSLFAELVSGKVVVLVWVMPCASCINDARGAYDAAESFSTTNPGKVVYYMADDIGNTSCGTLSGWANTNGIKPNVTFFGNSGTAINENDYGGPGMPHVVVIGPDKKIYFNVRNGSDDYNAIKDAISQALTSTGFQESAAPIKKLGLYPNPAAESLVVKYELTAFAETQYTILNSLGEIITTGQPGNLQAGKQEIHLDVSTLKNGVYCLKLRAGNSEQVVRFVVSR